MICPLPVHTGSQVGDEDSSLDCVWLLCVLQATVQVSSKTTDDGGTSEDTTGNGGGSDGDKSSGLVIYTISG